MKLVDLETLEHKVNLWHDELDELRNLIKENKKLRRMLDNNDKCYPGNSNLGWKEYYEKEYSKKLPIVFTKGPDSSRENYVYPAEPDFETSLITASINRMGTYNDPYGSRDYNIAIKINKKQVFYQRYISDVSMATELAIAKINEISDENE
jgi:hypothetical protein